MTTNRYCALSVLAENCVKNSDKLNFLMKLAAPCEACCLRGCMAAITCNSNMGEEIKS